MPERPTEFIKKKRKVSVDTMGNDTIINSMLDVVPEVPKLSSFFKNLFSLFAVLIKCFPLFSLPGHICFLMYHLICF